MKGVIVFLVIFILNITAIMVLAQDQDPLTPKPKPLPEFVKVLPQTPQTIQTYTFNTDDPKFQNAAKKGFSFTVPPGTKLDIKTFGGVDPKFPTKSIVAPLGGLKVKILSVTQMVLAATNQFSIGENDQVGLPLDNANRWQIFPLPKQEATVAMPITPGDTSPITFQGADIRQLTPVPLVGGDIRPMPTIGFRANEPVTFNPLYFSPLKITGTVIAPDGTGGYKIEGVRGELAIEHFEYGFNKLTIGTAAIEPLSIVDVNWRGGKIELGSNGKVYGKVPESLPFSLVLAPTKFNPEISYVPTSTGIEVRVDGKVVDTLYKKAGTSLSFFDLFKWQN